MIATHTNNTTIVIALFMATYTNGSEKADEHDMGTDRKTEDGITLHATKIHFEMMSLRPHSERFRALRDIQPRLIISKKMSKAMGVVLAMRPTYTVRRSIESVITLPRLVLQSADITSGLAVTRGRKSRKIHSAPKT